MIIKTTERETVHLGETAETAAEEHEEQREESESELNAPRSPVVPHLGNPNVIYKALLRLFA